MTTVTLDLHYGMPSREKMTSGLYDRLYDDPVFWQEVHGRILEHANRPRTGEARGWAIIFAVEAAVVKRDLNLHRWWNEHIDQVLEILDAIPEPPYIGDQARMLIEEYYRQCYVLR